MNFINGLQLDVEYAIASAYGSPLRQTRRLLWYWLNKVIGWVDHDKIGTKWDPTPLLAGTDGATDSSNPLLFSSATGGFTSALIGHALCICPTDAETASTGGFTDPTQNGFWRVRNVLSDTTLVVQRWMGVNNAGFPLSETGLNFKFINFYSNSELPSDYDEFVLEGQHSDATPFHFYNQERYSTNYGRGYFQISPYADWDNVGHAWNVSNRVSPLLSVTCTQAFNISSPMITVYAGGDANWFWMFAYSSSSGGQYGLNFWSGGEVFNPFHAADTKPSIVLGLSGASTSISPWSGIMSGARGTNADGTAPLSLSGRYMCKNRDASTQVADSSGVTNTRYSGRHLILPMILTSENAGYEAVRGQFKFFHGQRSTYVGVQPYVFGASKEWIHIYDHVFPWNGSDVTFQYPGAV